MKDTAMGPLNLSEFYLYVPSAEGVLSGEGVAAP